MIKNIKDLELSKETFELYIKALNSGANYGKKTRSPKYLLIDWEGWEETDFNFSLFDYDEDALHELFGNEEYINSDSLLSALYRHIETSNEEFLWDTLVDANRWVSHELYCKNTYDENLAILHRMRTRSY